MKLYNKIYSFIIVCCLMMAVNVRAAVFEHIGDRIILHVDEMQLHGDESVFDVIMTMPDIMTDNGRTVSSNMNDQWQLRIENFDINMDVEAFLRNTNACDIKTIKICVHPGTMKGSGGTKKVIDLYYRSKDNGTSGSHTLEFGTHLNGTLYNTLEYQHNNVNLKAWLVGDMNNEKTYGNDYQTHSLREDAKVLMTWDASQKDKCVFNINQTAQKTHDGDDPSSKYNTYLACGRYDHEFNSGASTSLTLGGEFDDNRGATGSHLHSTVIFTCLEGSIPLFSKNLWITPGVETGYAYTNFIVGDITQKQHYADMYLQADWTCKKFHFSIGDRYRILTYWINSDAYTTTWNNHYFNTSAWYDFNSHHTLQATFDKRFFSPEYSAFLLTDDDGNTTGYTTDVYHPKCYVSELRYTYQKEKLIITSLIQDTWQEFDRSARSKTGDDNMLSVGVTANWIVSDCFRLLIGATWTWEHYNNNLAQFTKYHQYANIRFAPEFRVNGWRFLATVVYNTINTSEDEVYPYYRPNCYGALRISKNLSKHWDIYAYMHDLIDERAGNREAIFGVTYKW